MSWSSSKVEWWAIGPITVRGVVLNLTVTCQRCDVNLTVVDLWYEQFWELVILLMRIDKWSLKCQRCSVNLTRIALR